MKWTRSTWLIPFVVATLGCGGAGDDAPPFLDGGPVRDATIVDGGAALDAAPADAAPADAGGRRDAGGPACPHTECNPLGDGCDEPASCRLVSGGTMCVEPQAEPVDEGGACAASEDCAPGLTCFRRGDGGVCGQPCCPGMDDSCTGERTCHGPGVLADGSETDWWSCVEPRSCRPLEPAADCEPGEACYIVSREGDTDCRRAGDGETGDACLEQNDCGPGFFCAGLTTPTCVRICSLGDAGTAATCPTSEGNCRAYSHSPPGTGLCTVEMAASAR